MSALRKWPAIALAIAAVLALWLAWALRAPAMLPVLPAQVYAALDAQFSKEEQVKLTMMINVINGWNRLAVGFDLFAPELGWKA